MFTVSNNEKVNNINENTNFVAIAEVNANTLKMMKNKVPYIVLAIGETEDEVLENASAEWFLNYAIVEGWYKVVAIDEIEVA